MSTQDGDAYWVALSKPGAPGVDGAPGKDGDPVVISQDTPPPVTLKITSGLILTQG